MSFTENLKVEIESVFDSKGFRQLEAQLGRTMAKFKGMEKMMNRAKGMRNLTGEAQNMQNVLNEAGLNFEGVNESIENMSGQQIGGKISRFGDQSELAKQQWRELGGFVTDAKHELVDFGPMMERTANAQERINKLGSPFEGRGAPGREMSTPLETMKSRGFDANKFQIPSIGGAMGAAEIQGMAGNLGVLQAETGKVKNITGRTKGAFHKFKGSIAGAAGKISGDMLPSLQSLQMTLLGVQFQLLSLAFIFGGLMGSALGAVGVFEILGNTLKMFFLPTALEILPLVLDLRDALLGIDEDTRKSIGRIFAIIAAVSALGSILAFAVNGFLAFLQPLRPIVQLLGGLLKHLGATKGIMSGVKAIAGKLAGAFNFLFQGLSKLIPGMKVISASLGTVLSFLGGLAAGFLAVTTVAARFGKKIALVFGLVLAAIGVVVAAIVSAPVAIAAAIGVAIGAILGILWTFKDTVFQIFMSIVNFAIGSWMTMFKGIVNIFKGLVNIIQGIVTFIVALFLGNFDKAFKGIKEAFKGLVQFIKGLVQAFLAPFVEIYKRLVGNSIIPDMVKSIVSWILSIPKKIAGIGSSIINTIVDGITSMTGAIWNAFKKIMPDFVIDAIENTGQAIGGIVNGAGEVIGKGGDVLGDVAGGIGDAVGGLASGAVNAAGDFASGVGNVASNLNPMSGGNGGGQKNVQNNQVNATVEVNDKEETPQETGRQFGHGLSNSLNSRQSNFSGGT